MLAMSTARRTALLSLAAAVGLALVKLVVGLASGSLGVLAEAVHSGLDAVASLVTLYAIGVAERPPDASHQYGHGKAQYLSALAEALILILASAWIAFEAVTRLQGGGGHVEAAWYAIVLMVVVLVVDAGRVTVSLRVGRRERSPAILAEAWHFGSDLVGTVAVLLGLVLVAAGYQGADSIAALLVAALVAVAATRLAMLNVDGLMDRAPAGLAGRVAAAAGGVPGVREVRSVRVREAGGESFADVVIGVSRLEGLERSHQTMDLVEAAVRERVGPAQVTVHVEPSVGSERANERVAAAALRVPGVVEIHNITVLEDGVDGTGQAITLHVRLPEGMSLARAGETITRLKAEINRELGGARVFAHVEPSALDPQPARDVTDEEPEVTVAAAGAVRSVAGTGGEIHVYRQGDRLLVVTSVHAERSLTVRAAHLLASRVEDAVRERLAGVDEVIVEVTGT